MEFVAGGVGRAQQQDEAGGEGAARPKNGVDEGAIEEDCQHCVFGNMGCFADEKLNPNYGERGNGRKQPAEKGNNNPRSMFRRHQVGGPSKNDRHPQNNG